MLKHDVDDQAMGNKDVYLLGYRKGLHLNVSRGSNHRSFRLTGRTNMMSIKWFVWYYHLVGWKGEIVVAMHYLRLMSRALSRSSRSLARISFLFSSSSATFSSTADRLLAFRSKMTAPEYIWVAFNWTYLSSRCRFPLHLRFWSHLCSWSCGAGSDSWRWDRRHERNSIFLWPG